MKKDTTLGLRAIERAPECRVYDAATMELKRIEKPYSGGKDGNFKKPYRDFRKRNWE